MENLMNDLIPSDDNESPSVNLPPIKEDSFKIWSIIKSDSRPSPSKRFVKKTESIFEIIHMSPALARFCKEDFKELIENIESELAIYANNIAEDI